MCYVWSLSRLVTSQVACWHPWLNTTCQYRCVWPSGLLPDSPHLVTRSHKVDTQACFRIFSLLLCHSDWGSHTWHESCFVGTGQLPICSKNCIWPFLTLGGTHFTASVYEAQEPLIKVAGCKKHSDVKKKHSDNHRWILVRQRWEDFLLCSVDSKLLTLCPFTEVSRCAYL